MDDASYTKFTSHLTNAFIHLEEIRAERDSVEHRTDLWIMQLVSFKRSPLPALPSIGNYSGSVCDIFKLTMYSSDCVILLFSCFKIDMVLFKNLRKFYEVMTKWFWLFVYQVWLCIKFSNLNFSFFLRALSLLLSD